MPVSGTAASAGVPSELVVRADATNGGQGVLGRKQSGAAIGAAGSGYLNRSIHGIHRRRHRTKKSVKQQMKATLRQE